MRLAAAVVAALLLATGAGAQPVPEPSGFRGEPYLAPTPDTLAGARVLDAAGTARAARHGAVLIDVLPRVRRPAALPPGTIWRDPVHDSIPGAVWLPGTGYEKLSAADEKAFEQALHRLSGGRRDAALVFFCKADCWMSWNAARRAVLLGYTGVAWFPGGTDEWAAQPLPLEPIEPPDG